VEFFCDAKLFSTLRIAEDRNTTRILQVRTRESLHLSMRVKDTYPIHLFLLLLLRGRTVRLDIPTTRTTFIYRHVLLVSAKGARKEYSVLVLLIDIRRRERGLAGWTVRTARARGVTNLRSGWMGLIGGREVEGQVNCSVYSGCATS
jgi:hypothetical protein